MKVCFGCAHYDSPYCEYCDEQFNDYYDEPAEGSVMWFVKSYAESTELLNGSVTMKQVDFFKREIEEIYKEMK